MRNIHVGVMVGTRLDAIKMLPIILAAQERPDRFQVAILRRLPVK
jgi:hypothetical protein